MDRKTLIFWLLPFLPSLFVSANAGINSTTMHNCTEFDMANIQELISTLQTVEEPQIDPFISVEMDSEIIQPFGNLKTDWMRLNLLHDALPEDSAIKNKFKHLSRLLLIAHNQATRFSLPTESEKVGQDFYNKQSTVAESEDIRGPVVQLGEFLNSRKEELKTILTTPIFLFNGDRNAIPMESLTKAPHKDSKVETYSTITAAPNSPSEFRESNIGDILMPSTTVYDVDTKFSTPVNKELKSSSVIMLPIYSSAEKYDNSRGKTTEEIFRVEFPLTFETLNHSMTENFLKGESNESSGGEIFSTVASVETIEPFKSKSTDLSTSTTEQTDEISLLSNAKSGHEFSNIKEYSAAIISSSVPTKNGSTVLISSDTPLISSAHGSTDTSWSDSTMDHWRMMDTLLANNFGAETAKEQFVTDKAESTLIPEIDSSSTRLGSEKNEYSTTSGSSKVLGTENTSIITSANEKNEEIELESLNNGTDSNVSEKSTSSWSTTDFTERCITSTSEPDVAIAGTPEENQSDVSMSEKSIVATTSDSIETTIDVAPTIKQDDKGLYDQTGYFANHKSTTNDWRSTESTEKAAFISVVTDKTQEINSAIKQDDKSQGLSDETEFFANTESTTDEWRSTESTVKAPIVTFVTDKTGEINSGLKTSEIKLRTIAELKFESASSRSTSEATTNPTKVLNETEASKITTQSSLPTKLSSKVQNIEIPEKRIEINAASIIRNNLGVMFNDAESTTTVSEKFQSGFKIPIINFKPSFVENSLNASSSRILEAVTSRSSPEVSTNTTKVMNETEAFKIITQSSLPAKISANVKNIEIPEERIEMNSASNIRNNLGVKFNDAETTTTINEKFQSSFKIPITNFKPSLVENPLNTSSSRIEAVSSKSIPEVVTNPTAITDKEVPNKITQSFLPAKLSTQAIKIPEVRTEINAASDTRNNFGFTFDEAETTATIADEFQPVSKTWINSKPSYIKNPLNNGFSGGNIIYQDFKHISDEAGAEKKSPADKHTVLYESGSGVKTGSMRPQLARQSPVGNNIRRLDNSNNARSDENHRQSTKFNVDVRKDEKNPSKFPTQDRRPNVLRSRKRGSPNADIEKQFRSFYRTGVANPAHKTRDKQSRDMNIKIRCKKTQRR